jgi:hypothetical protein
VPPAPSTAEARAYYYRDNGGVSVATTAVSLDQRASSDVRILGRAVADRISVERQVLDPGDPGAAAQLTGHHDADAVTSASATAGGGGVAQKWRFEGQLGAEVARAPGGLPATLRLTARGGHEPDYRSLSAQLQGTLELFDRNTSLSAFVGGGNDWVIPIEEPPGQQGQWPAQHHRLTLGASASQLLSPRLVLLGGFGMTLQEGMLANPYRRALVIAPGASTGTLFPEVLPGTRQRYTAFLGGSWFAGHGLAVHFRQGAYLDSWDVRALIPELMLAKELFAGRGLLLARYRHYRQGPARFHESHYHTLDVRYLSGDPRLGSIRDHTMALEARWRLGPILTLALGYELSLLDYREENADIRFVAHIPTLGISAAY